MDVVVSLHPVPAFGPEPSRRGSIRREVTQPFFKRASVHWRNEVGLKTRRNDFRSGADAGRHDGLTAGHGLDVDNTELRLPAWNLSARNAQSIHRREELGHAAVGESAEVLDALLKLLPFCELEQVREARTASG